MLVLRGYIKLYFTLLTLLSNGIIAKNVLLDLYFEDKNILNAHIIEMVKANAYIFRIRGGRSRPFGFRPLIGGRPRGFKDARFARALTGGLGPRVARGLLACGTLSVPIGSASKVPLHLEPETKKNRATQEPD